MIEQADALNSRGKLTDWLLRGAIGIAFLAFGAEKFTDPQWVKFFQQLGWGMWFRYFTGVVEVLGGLLLFLPWTATAGLALLICTMGSATLIWIFFMGQPANGIITGAFCGGLLLFWLNRRGN
jgi:putative oxidoreductase